MISVKILIGVIMIISGTLIIQDGVMSEHEKEICAYRQICTILLSQDGEIEINEGSNDTNDTN